MTYSIDEFKSAIGKGGGIAMNNTFRVTLPALEEKSGETIRSFNLLCKAVNIPGKQIATGDRIIGPINQKMVNGVIFADVTLTFMLLNDYGIKNYFDRWADLAIDPNTYELGYKHAYAKPVKIEALKKGFALPVYKTSLGIPKLPSSLQNRLPKIGPFDLAQGELDLSFVTEDEVMYEVELEDAFPTAITGIDYDNEAGQIAEINIALAYTNWKSKKQKQDPMSDLVKLGLGSLASRVGGLL
jgi:hypothetical protein